MDNTKYHTMDVKKCCQSKLGIEFRSGNEYNGWFILNGQKAARVTIPKGRKPIPPKTYKSMARQLKLTTTELDQLLQCPMTWQNYQQLIRNRTL